MPDQPDAPHRLEIMSSKSQVAIYYVGPRFHGWLLDAATIFPEGGGAEHHPDLSFDPGDELFLGYGETCDGSSCGPSFEMDVHLLSSKDLGEKCVGQLSTTRGVTPAELDPVGVEFFVGRLVVTFPDQPPPALVAATVGALRAVGEPSTSKGNLPAPRRRSSDGQGNARTHNRDPERAVAD